jgi:hypothetical protein
MALLFGTVRVLLDHRRELLNTFKQVYTSHFVCHMTPSSLGRVCRRLPNTRVAYCGLT